jgi:phosphopantetheinyl transferase (holo-ACP synthase)
VSPAAPRVGNDVVDLEEAARGGDRRRARFVERVCSAAERALLAAAADPTALLWQLFAAKEAAYKVVAKPGPAPVFAHRRFEVASDLRAVRYDGQTLSLELCADARRVHALAWTGARPQLAGVCERAAGVDERDAVRDAACAALAAHLGCDPADLEIVRDPAPGTWTGLGPPWLRRAGARAAADLSLSHHGRFLAYAAQL